MCPKAAGWWKMYEILNAGYWAKSLTHIRTYANCPVGYLFGACTIAIRTNATKHTQQQCTSKLNSSMWTIPNWFASQPKQKFVLCMWCIQVRSECQYFGLNSQKFGYETIAFESAIVDMWEAVQSLHLYVRSCIDLQVFWAYIVRQVDLYWYQIIYIICNGHTAIAEVLFNLPPTKALASSSLPFQV